MTTEVRASHILVATEEEANNLRNEIINGKNFYLQTAIPKDNEIKDNLIGKNTTSIKFNQINNGTQKTITGSVCSGDSYDSTKAEALNNNINNYSQVNEIVFRGTHVNDLTGEETKIEKKVNVMFF